MTPEPQLEPLSQPAREQADHPRPGLPDSQAARAALEAERDYYRELFNTAPDAYVLTDPAGKITAANQAAAELLHAPSRRLVGKPLAVFFSGDSRRELRERVRQIAGGRQPQSWEDRVQPRGRPALEVVVSVQPWEAAGPERRLELRWRFQNIAGRRKSQQALRDSEARYRQLLHASLEAIYLYELYSRRLLEANPAFLRLLGYTPDEIPRLTVYDIVAEERASIEERWHQIQAGGPADLGERQWRHKDGRLIDVQVTASRIRQGERDIVAIIGRDITEHRAAAAQLRESEARYRRLAENAPDIIYRYRLKPDSAYEYLSPTVTRLLGFTPEEFYADPHLGLRQTHPDDQETLRVAPFDPGRGGQPMLIRRFTKDGRIVWTEQRPVVLYDEHGEAVAVEGIIRDITAQVAATQENERLYAAERDQRALAEALRRTAELLNSTLDFEQVQDQILAHAGTLVPYDLAVITMLEGDTHFRNVRSRASGPYRLAAAERQPLYALEDFELLSEVAHTAQPQTIADTATHPGWVVLPELAWVRSQVVAPLRLKGHVEGFISLSSHTPNYYEPQHAPRLQALADQAAVALENALLFDQLRTGRQQLQDLSQRLLEVQETERRQIARELHDEIGQALTGLKLFLEADHRGSESARDKLGQVRTLVEDLINRVRDLSLDLRPTMLDDLGLLPALLWQFERYAAQTGIYVSFQHFGIERRFDPDVETAAYRIVQEALTNVARHAGVTTVTVTLWADVAMLTVQIEDSGRGFDLARTRSDHASSGLAGMRERATLRNGQFTVESAPGAGTQITAELPLRQAAPALSRSL